MPPPGLLSYLPSPSAPATGPYGMPLPAPAPASLPADASAAGLSPWHPWIQTTVPRPRGVQTAELRRFAGSSEGPDPPASGHPGKLRQRRAEILIDDLDGNPVVHEMQGDLVRRLAMPCESLGGQVEVVGIGGRRTPATLAFEHGSP